MLKIFYLSISKHLLLTTVLPLIIIMIFDTLLYAYQWQKENIMYNAQDINI